METFVYCFDAVKPVIEQLSLVYMEMVLMIIETTWLWACSFSFSKELENDIYLSDISTS